MVVSFGGYVKGTNYKTNGRNHSCLRENQTGKRKVGG